MSKNDIYVQLGYEGFLLTPSEISLQHPEHNDIIAIGADKVYFSGDFPTVLFVDVNSFDDLSLKKIAKIHHKAWNYRRALLLFAISDTEIRVYNCHEKPERINDQLPIEPQLAHIELLQQNVIIENLSLLNELFSRIGVDCGLLWTSDSAIREKIKVKRRVDNFLAETMKQTATKLKDDGISDDKIVHGLLMRSLFILFLEDKGAAKEAGLYAGIKEGAGSYFDILGDKSATYKLFDEVKKHFNGNVFPVLPNESEVVTQEHLKLIRNCFLDGNLSENQTLFNDWRLFNFEIIEVELLSEIYENFLGAFREERGQHYTPFSLVEFILNDKLPSKGMAYNVKILDPACGSGIFLVESFKRLVKRWKNAHPNSQIGFDDLKQILTDNIYGIEIDETAIRVAAFSLYLALVDELEPKTLWIKTNYQLPYLICDPEDSNIQVPGHNLWRCDTMLVEPKKFGEVDLVIGNPPFGTDDLLDSIKDYCDKYKFAREQVLPFIHKSVSFCPAGEIALIFNSKVLTNTQKPYQRFRKWLFDNYVEKVNNLSIFRKAPQDFGGQLFSSAVGPVSIVYFRKEAQGGVSDTIEYWAPKTFVKSNLIEGVVVDSSDVKYLPRTECKKPDTKIWKIAMWGNMQDFRLISRLQRNPLRSLFTAKDAKWIKGSGLNSDSQKPDICPKEIIKTDRIDRYYTNPQDSVISNHKWYRTNIEGLFEPPFILFKKGLYNTEITSSIFNERYYCATGVFIINNPEASIEVKKLLVAYFNSDIVKYFLFLCTSSWGIEREQIMLDELLDVPNILGCNISEQDIQLISQCFDEIVKERQSALISADRIKDNERQIFSVLCKYLKLSERDRILISDLINSSMGVFFKGFKSVAFKRTIKSENVMYASTLCDEINNFLKVSSSRVSATIFDVQLCDPLNLVVLHFGETESSIQTRNVDDFRNLLSNIDNYTLQQKAGSIYVKKQVRYYDNDTVYLIKPNQKRFWTRSQAMEDATSLISEILTMNNGQ